MSDPIHNPAHYTAYPVQPIEISRHLGFCLGNVVKYMLRAPYKGGIEDCNKALKYLEWEKETPGQPISYMAFTNLRESLDELAGYLASTANENAWDDDIMDIQAEFLLNLKLYLYEYESVDALTDCVRDLVRAIAGKAKEEAQS